MSIEEPLLKFHSSPLSDEFKNLAKHVENCFQLNLFGYGIITPSGMGLQVVNITKNDPPVIIENDPFGGLV